MDLLIIFIAISLLFGAGIFFLWNELQNEKRLREIFTRRTKDCEKDITELNIKNEVLASALSILIGDVQDLEKELEGLKQPKRKTTKKGSSKR